MSVFKKHADQIRQFFGEFPVIAGNMAMNHFDKSFTDKGFTDKNLEKWKPVVDRKTKKVKERPLVRTGQMRRSTHMDIDGSSVTIYNDTEYSKYHNEGGHKPGRPPKRQFIGPSQQLEKKIQDHAEDKLNEILNVNTF